jgi:hypothetical protein
MAKFHRLAMNDRLKIFWKLRGPWHHCTVDKYRHYANSSPQRVRNLKAHKIVWIVESPITIGIACIEPV